MLRCTLLFSLFLATSFSSSAALSVDISASTTPVNNASLLYSYSISNDLLSTTNLFQFTLNDVADSMAEVSGPVGWWITVDPTAFSIQWTSSDFSFDLVPGTTQTGFSYTSSFLPVDGGYLLESYDPQTFIGEFASGIAPVPGTASVASVTDTPEPGTLFPVLLTALVYLSVATIRKKTI